MSTTTEEIKSRLDIADFISGYLRLQKAGRNFRALCPFHNEKTPSFMVSQERQIWHCFGCGESGDIFSFLMKIEGIDFKDALGQLAERAGVRIEKFKSDAPGKRQRIYAALEAASGFFKKNLWENGGRTALQYLKERGLTDQTIKEFDVGYSPESWGALLKFLEERKFSIEHAFEAGLVVRRENDAGWNHLSPARDYYDRFRDRIMFPIKDIGGRAAGFSARVMPGGDDKTGKPADNKNFVAGKYINTPETLVYNKSRIIYGLDKAKLAIRKKNFCILVEGQLDVIMSHQAGIKNVVATSGTALTAEHLAIIKRYTKNLALCFDSDEAGGNATKKSIDMAIASGLATKIIILNGGKDPADIIKQDPKKWAEAIIQKKSVIAFYFNHALSRYSAGDIEGRKKIAEELLPVIKLIPNYIERAHYIQELSLKIKADEKTLEAQMKETGNEPTSRFFARNNLPERATKKNSRAEQLGEFVLGTILLYPELKSGIIKNILAEWFSDDNQKTIFEKIKTQDEFDLNRFIGNLDEPLKETVGLIIFKTEQEIEQRDINPAKVVGDYVSELKKLHRKNYLDKLGMEIKQAEAAGDKNLVKKITQEFIKVSRVI